MNKKKNESGFSLVEVLVACGLLGGLALGLAKFTQDAGKSKKTMESNFEINLILTDIANIVSNSANCLESFKGPIGKPILAIKRNKDGVFKEAYKLNTPYADGLLVIENMWTMEDDAGIKLVLEFQKAGDIYGSKNITKKIPLAVETIASSIESCGSAGPVTPGPASSGTGETVSIYKRSDGTLTLNSSDESYSVTCQYCRGGGTFSCNTTCVLGYADNGSYTDTAVIPLDVCGPSGARMYIIKRTCT